MFIENNIYYLYDYKLISNKLKKRHELDRFTWILKSSFPSKLIINTLLYAYTTIELNGSSFCVSFIIWSLSLSITRKFIINKSGFLNKYIYIFLSNCINCSSYSFFFLGNSTLLIILIYYRLIIILKKMQQQDYIR